MSAATRRAHDPHDPGRRRALKIGAAAGVGGLVWTEPTIKGLARRPAYADALSSPVAFSWAGADALTPELLSALSITPSDVTISLAPGSPNATGEILQAVYKAGTPEECSCTFSDIAAGTLTLSGDNGASVTNLAVTSGDALIQFDGSLSDPIFLPRDPANDALSGPAINPMGSCG